VCGADREGTRKLGKWGRRLLRQRGTACVSAKAATVDISRNKKKEWEDRKLPQCRYTQAGARSERSPSKGVKSADVPLAAPGRKNYKKRGGERKEGCYGG